MEKDPTKNTEIDLDKLENMATDDPFLTKLLSEALEAKENGDKEQYLGKIAEAADYAREKEESKEQGFTIDDDPIQGYTENPEKIREFNEKYPMPEAKVVKATELDSSSEAPEGEVFELDHESAPEPEDKIEPIPQAVKAKKIETLAKAPEEEADEPEAKRDTSENKSRLKEVFEKGLEIRDDYKNPGNPRYRLMSVAAGDLWKIKQPEKVEDRVDAVNDAIENAVKTAFGSDELDDYAKDTLAAVKLYFGETMIGDDADSVSIGTTETLVNSSGQIGDKSDIYGNMVILRWIKNNVNHVVAFSPKQGTGIYALVDDSNGDSWKETFLRAGAVNGYDRKKIFTMDHEEHLDTYHHEKSYEKVVKRMVMKEIASINSDEYDLEDMEKVVSSCEKTLKKLAHVKTDIVDNMHTGEMNDTVRTSDQNKEDDDKLG